jgi:hypothetical protein
MGKSSMVPHCEATPGKMEQVAKDRAFLVALTVLSAVASPYDSIDLQAIGEGFVDGWSNEELDTLKWAPAADALAMLVSPNAMLQGREEEQ